MTTARPGPSLPDPAEGDCLVSIVIVSWNTRELLRPCLRSTLAASRELARPFEVTVVDNASGDGSAEMVRNEFPTVRLIRNGSNAGFAAATNQGIRESCGRYLLLLNPDTEATPDFLRNLVSFLEEHPEAAAAGPRILGTDGEDQVSCFPLPTLTRELWRLFHLDRLRARASYPPGRLGSEEPQNVESIQGSCFLVRRVALEQTGALDERFFIYTEEIDLCRRLLDCGWRIYWVPRAVIVHYGGASTAQVGGRMFLELYRSKVQYFRKHLGVRGAFAYKAVLLVASLPRIFVPSLVMPFMPARREQWRALVKNYATLLMHLHAL